MRYYINFTGILQLPDTPIYDVIGCSYVIGWYTFLATGIVHDYVIEKAHACVVSYVRTRQHNTSDDSYMYNQCLAMIKRYDWQ